MKRFILLVFLATALHAVAQKQTFDLATFTPPRGWKKQAGEIGIQFSKEDTGKGAYCIITLYKAAPATPVSEDNFELAWASLVKEMVTVSGEPEMEPSAKEDGWEIVSGHAAFEQDGSKGMAILVTCSGFRKMMNLVILTNTGVYEKDITAFLESIKLKKPEPGLQHDTQSTGKVAITDVFKFTTTKLVEGWTSTVQADWVWGEKGNVK